MGGVGPSFDDRKRPQEERRRDRQAERSGGLHVDDELESIRALDWEIGGGGDCAFNAPAARPAQPAGSSLLLGDSIE